MAGNGQMNDEGWGEEDMEKIFYFQKKQGTQKG